MNTENTSTIAGRSLLAGLGCIFLAVLFSVKTELPSRNSLTNDETNTIISKIDNAFDLAEQKILKIDPIPDNEPNGPHPDVDKCVCKGTGKITHGDGHKTDCPYHGGEISKSMNCKCDTRNTYCNCTEAYGKCSCTKPRRIFNFFGTR